MSKILKNNEYEQEADQLSAGIARKSATEKELKKNLGDSLRTDFSDVKVSHEDLNGETAYAQGNEIHLDHSVDTGTSFGRQVLGHEMVHTAQQSGQSSMVSQAPAGAAQFFPERDANGDMKLKNKFSYRKDKEYQVMYKAYNTYIKDKKNPQKKMEAMKAASDYVMHNTDLSEAAGETNMGKRQLHRGRMAVAEQIMHDLTIGTDTVAKATGTLDFIQGKARMAEDRGPEDEAMKRANLGRGMDMLRSVAEGKAGVSKTLETVTAGTLGNHMGASAMNLTNVTMEGSSGVTPTYDSKGNVAGKSLKLNAGMHMASKVGATTLHELTHLANGNIYGNTMEMSVARDVSGENREERNQRHRAKASRRHEYLDDLNRAGIKMWERTRKMPLKDRKDGIDLQAIDYSGLNDKFSAQYAPNNVAGVLGGGDQLNNKQRGAVATAMSKDKIRDKEGLKGVLTADGVEDADALFAGDKGANVDRMLDLVELNEEMKQGDQGNLTSLIEYDSKMTDTLFDLETSGRFDESNPTHRRLKAMVMEAYAEREIQRIQNEMDSEGEVSSRPANVRRASQDEVAAQFDMQIKKQLASGDMELLDDPKVREHIMDQWKKKGSAVVGGKDFTHGYTGNDMATFRGNDAWVTNYGMLMKRAVTREGRSAADVAMEDITTGGLAGESDLAWNAMQASMNIADDIRDNQDLQELMRHGKTIFSGNETSSPMVEQTFLQNFLLNRVYTPELTKTAAATGDSQMKDISTMILRNSVLPTGSVPQFEEGSTNARLNPALRRMGHDQSINQAIGEALGQEMTTVPRRGFRRRRDR